MWANRAWVGPYFPASTRSGAELAVYAQWCNAVEGNTTFYALPDAETVDRWREMAPPGFRFLFKVPREVTHDRKLRHADAELRVFLERIAPLRECMGPLSVQLPASFEPEDLPVLDRFLAEVPRDVSWSVEVRHRDFEADGPAEREVNDLLHRHGVDRVLIDTRALFAAPPKTREEHEAWENKPRLAVRPVATAADPVVRFIGQSNAEATAHHWQPWVAKVAAWIEQGRRPHVMIHTPDNRLAPELNRRFHCEVAARVPTLEPLPDPPPPAAAQDTLW